VKKIQLLLTAACVSCVISSAAFAASLGLNFAATDPNAADSSLLPTEVAGVVPQPNWNNLALNNGDTTTPVPIPLLKDDGTPSGATVSWASPNTWRSTANNAFPAGSPDRKLTTGYLDSNNTAAGGVMISVNNIDAALRTPAYDVYVYFVSDSGADRGGGYTIDDGSGPILKFGSTLAMPSAHVEDPGTDSDNSLDGTYLRFAGLTGSSFRLTSDTTLTTPNGFRAPVNAIQIVQIPEPASAVLTYCGAALLGAIVWRRRRL